MKSRDIGLALFVCVAAITIFYYPRQPEFFSLSKIATTQAAEALPLYVGCPYAFPGKLEYTGVARVLKSGRPLQTPEAEKIVLAQMRHLNGLFNFTTGPNRVILTSKPQIVVDKIVATNYGMNLTLDRVHDERLPLNRTEIKKTDAAFEIQYSASQPVTICSSINTPPVDEKILLPYDPNVAFWLVPSSERRNIAFHSSLNRTNPCADRQIAELKWPSMYWYIWNPRAAGNDNDGQPYDCGLLLRPQFDYFETAARFVPGENLSSPLNFDQLFELPIWNVKIMLGWMSQKASAKTLKQTLDFFESQNLIEIARNLSSYPDVERLDVAAKAALHIIKIYNEIAKLDQIRIEKTADYLLLRIASRLKASGQNVDLEIYLGPTDHPQKKAKHWSYLKAALEDADILFYVGHAGMGANLDLSVAQTELAISRDDMAASIAKKSYQMFAIMSCHATSFFGTDYLEMRNHSNRTTDFLSEATDGYHPLAPMSILYFLDHLKSKAKVSLKKAMALGLRRSEILLLTRQGHL